MLGQARIKRKRERAALPSNVERQGDTYTREDGMAPARCEAGPDSGEGFADARDRRVRRAAALPSGR